MDTQTQIDRLIELAIIQRSELKQLVEQLPQLREHLNAEVEKVFDETEPQLRAELEEWTTKQTADKTAALGVALEAKIADLAKTLEVSTQARFNAIIAERAENARLAAEAEAKIAEHAASLPGAVKEIVSAELARFPRAGEIDQLRKEFAEPKSLNPRGKWQAGETYNKLDLVTINGDSYTSNTDGNRTRPSRSSADWTLVAARGTGGGGGPTSLSELTTVPSDGDVLIGSGTSWVTSNLTAGAGISITVGPGAITISATDGDITLDDGTAASPSLHFTNDADTGIYRPAANTLGISVSGTQVAYFDENGLTVPSAGVVAGGSIHAGNGNANNPSLSFDGDQDTGFFRHQPNEIGIALGGTQYATLTSTTFSITPVVTMASSLRVNSTTDSSSKDTGAIVTEGGLGVEKSASIGGNLTVSGTDVKINNAAGYFYVDSGSSLTGMLLSRTNNILELSTANNVRLTISAAGNTTLAGNLTVNSTTDASSVPTGSIYTAGGIAVGTNKKFMAAGTGGYWGAAAASTLDTLLIRATGFGYSPTSYAGVQIGGTASRSIIFGVDVSAIAGGQFTGASNEWIIPNTLNIRQVTSDNTNFSNAIFTIGNGGATTIGGNLTVSGTGNSSVAGTLLVATTTNSSNGKLQLATHTTSAGGIGFGTADSFYTAGVGDFRLKTTSAEAAITLLSGGAYIGSVTAGKSTFIVSGGGTTALTLDSSQNATFAGKATATRLIANSQWVAASAGTGALSATANAGVQLTGTGAVNDITLVNKNGDNVMVVPTGTTNATFAGAIAIGNTVNTVSPTSPNRTITMVIGGTTYYIHAKTTND